MLLQKTMYYKAWLIFRLVHRIYIVFVYLYMHMYHTWTEGIPHTWMIYFSYIWDTHIIFCIFIIVYLHVYFQRYSIISCTLEDTVASLSWVTSQNATQNGPKLRVVSQKRYIKHTYHKLPNQCPDHLWAEFVYHSLIDFMMIFVWGH